jgi:hypothetical protein
VSPGSHIFEAAAAKNRKSPFYRVEITVPAKYCKINVFVNKW